MTYPAIVAIGFPSDQGMSAVYKACSGDRRDWRPHTACRCVHGGELLQAAEGGSTSSPRVQG